MSSSAAAKPERAEPLVRLASAPALLPRQPHPLHEAFRRANRVAKPALGVLVLLAWLWFMLPQGLGGRAGWILVSGTSMEPHYHTGDLVLVERQSQYRVGQVIAYRVPQGDPMAGAQVIHRIVGGDAKHGFVVRGDNRTAPDVWHPKPQDIVGAKLLRLPHAITVIQYLRSPILLGLLAAFFVFVKLLGRKNERTGDKDSG
jgi:signal peptidase I